MDEALDQLFNGIETRLLLEQRGIDPVADGLADLACALPRFFGRIDAMWADRVAPQRKSPAAHAVLDNVDFLALGRDLQPETRQRLVPDVEVPRPWPHRIDQTLSNFAAHHATIGLELASIDQVYLGSTGSPGQRADVRSGTPTFGRTAHGNRRAFLLPKVEEMRGVGIAADWSFFI